MTIAGNGQRPSFKVIVSDLTKQIIKELHERAAQQGRGQQFLAALRVIYAGLRTDPSVFGEPLYHLPALKLLVYHAAFDGIVVVYGVHQEKPLVFVRHITALD